MRVEVRVEPGLVSLELAGQPLPGELGGAGGPFPPAVLMDRLRPAVLLAQRQAHVLLARPQLTVLLAGLRLVHPAPPICTAIRQHRAWPGGGTRPGGASAPRYFLFLRCTLVFRSSLRCFFLAIRLRRFLITEPTEPPSLDVIG